MKEYKLGSGIRSWKEGAAYSITFIVTEDCNLRCKYCYQVHKSNKKVMSIELARKAVNYFLDNSNLFNSDAVIWDFIGGEPLLEIDLIDEIADYIKIETYKRGHNWFNQYRFTMSTNGTLYHRESVRRFLKKNQGKCSVGITIDGTKTKHNLQRVYPDGTGSYDTVVKNIPLWLEEFPDATTKVTIGHADLPYLKESVIHLWDLGIKAIPANVVFEDVWQDGDDLIFENQLRDLADYILDNRLWDQVDCTLFDDKIGYPNDRINLERNHCGSGRMIAVDCDGIFYPCLRYVDYCLVNQKPYIIGNITDGIDFDRIRPFLGLNTKSQSSDECIDCEVAQGCAWCQANNYDLSSIGTNYQRAKYICKMHKARCKANNYFWGRLNKEFGIKKQGYFGRSHKRYLYFILADDSVEHCNYISKQISNNHMSEEVIEKAFRFSENNFYTPVILHSKNNNSIFLDKYSKNERIEIGNKMLSSLPNDSISVYNVENVNEELISTNNCILNVNENNIINLAESIKKLLTNSSRININLKIFNKTFDLDLYEGQLKRVVDIILQYKRNGKTKEINRITDRLYLDRMDNCEFGNYNFAVAPNGKFYICPAFYFNEPESDIGSLDEGITLIDKDIFKLHKSAYCSQCDSFQCNRCIYLNKKFTNEFNTPSSLQCKISHLERKMSLLLLEKLKAEKISVPNMINIEDIDYADPVELVIKDLDVNPYTLRNC